MSTPGVCVCTTVHRPPTSRPHEHHLWPKFLGGPPHPATLVHLCPTTHDLVHFALRGFLAHGWTPWTLRAGVPRYAHQIATLGYQAWSAASQPALTPRTVSTPDQLVPLAGGIASGSATTDRADTVERLAVVSDTR